MKTIPAILSIPALLVNFALISAANTVSVNFPGNAGANGTLAAADVAGVVPVANWNNSTASGMALVDSSGQASPVRVNYTVGGWSNQFVTATSANHRLMKGYLDIGQATATIQLTNLDPAQTYKIYIYSDGENSASGVPVSRTGGFTINGTVTGITDTAGEHFEGTFKEVYPGTTGEGNHTVVTVTGSSSYTISAAGSAADATDNVYRAPVNALQIVSVPPAP